MFIHLNELNIQISVKIIIFEIFIYMIKRIFRFQIKDARLINMIGVQTLYDNPGENLY